jgi:hypothetical protein
VVTLETESKEGRFIGKDLSTAYPLGIAAMCSRRLDNGKQYANDLIVVALYSDAPSVFVSQSAVQADSGKTTLVEVWSRGDDGLTMRLRASLESAFKSSSAFSLSSGKKPGTLIVTIPTNVGWRQVSKRTKVLYTVDFASVENQHLGISKGGCWDDALSKCTDKIVKDAIAVTHKVQRD